MLTARWEPTSVFSHDSLKVRRTSTRPSSPSLPCRHYAFEDDAWLRNRAESPFESSDELSSRSENGDTPRDRFIEIAQAALEEATKEEDQKGVIQEMLEALIATTGAQLMAEVIAEQLRGQEVIEQLAESHEDQRRNSSQLQDDFLHSPKEPLQHEEEQQRFDDTESVHLISEYIWRLFRLLFFASLVGLVCHFARVRIFDNEP
ncbi:hypothetical protein DFQ28_002687 [Apophysomyces sp. BC1034]|nr:hypothetical protein DFQ30_002562 [Apophysomyces sp. BC1015]KAG0176008.1 hypothetical protein DFQ29_006685 [Apophysomyces sp. BC1021]KAG0189962.1 hypothetical protein DFQ28_002687 [Apophysomyces sp. BC1034]